MRLLESKKGLSFFAFEHSEEYQQTQHKFLAAVESMEPNNIVVRESLHRTGPGTMLQALLLGLAAPPVRGPGGGRAKVETPGYRVLSCHSRQVGIWLRNRVEHVWAGGCRDSSR